MSNMDIERRDQMFGKLHQLAELSSAQLKENFTPDNVKFIRELVSEFWVNKTVNDELTPDQFADIVHALRAEEREWSKKLGAMIVAAEDRLKEGDTKEIEKYFDYFLKNCPCLSLASIAEVERANFLGNSH